MTVSPSPNPVAERLSLPDLETVRAAALKFSSSKDEDSVGALAWNFICMFRHLAALSLPPITAGRGEALKPQVRPFGSVPSVFEVVADAYGLSGSLPAAPGWRPTHRHVKRGSDYQVVGSASLQAGEPVGEAAILVVYRDVKGRLWARPEVEFDDGRFEPIASPAKPTTSEELHAPGEPG